MSETPLYSARLIEATLPIKRLSTVKSRRPSPGDIDVRSIGLWWSRKPQNQVRAILVAALLPDPVAGGDDIKAQTRDVLSILARYSLVPSSLPSPESERRALSAFCELVADPGAHETLVALALAEILTCLGVEGAVALDPFAGGGSIPIEAQRLGLHAIAGEYNPLAALQLRASMEWPKNEAMASLDEVEADLKSAVRQAHSEMNEYFVAHPEWGLPIGYVNVRRLVCEGPACGRLVPASSKFLLNATSNAGCVFRAFGKPGSAIEVELVSGPEHTFPKPTIRGGHLECPACDFVTRRASVAKQHERLGHDPIIVAAVYRTAEGRSMAPLTGKQWAGLNALAVRSAELVADWQRWVPTEEWPKTEPRRFSPPLYGYRRFADCHTLRQRVYLARTVASMSRHQPTSDSAQRTLYKNLSALLVARLVERHTSFCRWRADRGGSYEWTFAGKSIGMIWDFFEANPVHHDHSAEVLLAEIVDHLRRCRDHLRGVGDVIPGAAQDLPLPDDSVDILYTDPPYFDAIPYSHLSDWPLVWAGKVLNPESVSNLSPKDAEITVDRPHSKSPTTHDDSYFRRELAVALRRCAAVLKPAGIGIIVFAHTSTVAWESLVDAVLTAGLVVTASWPVETERGGRLQAQGTASLQSSVHLICRPREHPDGSLRVDDVGDWRDVLRELPVRMHDWMPRLAEDGVVGADAIFACLGPALEIFSRYSRVERIGGDAVTLKEYLEQVWAAVSKEALCMIFRDADTDGLEPDARVSAMWLWTLAGPSGIDGADVAGSVKAGADGEDDEEGSSKKKEKSLGFALEYDAARKIAQGLGATLENLTNVVEVTGDKARLLSVGERAAALFVKSDAPASVEGIGAPKKQQLKLFEEEIESAAKEQGWDASGAPTAGRTALDRVHQAMLLFGTGRSEALKRFLVEEGAGRQASFWKLAQALSALYPPGCDEKRWVDGVLVRKKGLGF